MKAIYFLDLKREFKSVKTGIISFIFIILSYLIAKYSTSISIIMNDNGSSPAVDTLFGIYAFLGLLFSSILFSGIISREIELETFRYITPYSSRKKIYLAKYFVMITYFLSIVLVSLLILFSIRQVFIIPLKSILDIFIFFMYTEALVLLISTVCNQERLATLIGITLSLLFPILFAVTFFKDNILIDMLNWLLPYKYIGSTWEILLLLLLTLAILFVGMRIFERKEI